MRLTHQEEFVLFVLSRSPWGISSYAVGQRWSTESDDRWAQPKLKALRDAGLVQVNKSKRPWRYQLTDAGNAEVIRRQRQG